MCCEGQHTGEASAAGRPVLTMRLGKRTSPAGAWQLQSPSPAHGTSCLPPPHQWGPPPPSFCRKRTRAPGVEVTSPRRPECGRGQTRRSKGKGRAVPGWAVVLEAVLAPGAKAWVRRPRTTRISPKHRHRAVSRSGAIVPGFQRQAGPHANSASALVTTGNLSEPQHSHLQNGVMVAHTCHGAGAPGKPSLLPGLDRCRSAPEFGCPEPRVTACSSMNLASSKES